MASAIDWFDIPAADIERAATFYGTILALERRWPPYYDEGLRAKRLEQARVFCLNDLDRIPLYVERGLYFQSPGRLWNAFRELGFRRHPCQNLRSCLSGWLRRPQPIVVRRASASVHAFM